MADDKGGATKPGKGGTAVPAAPAPDSGKDGAGIGVVPTSHPVTGTPLPAPVRVGRVMRGGRGGK
jgi:hypothetical protein